MSFIFWTRYRTFLIFVFIFYCTLWSSEFTLEYFKQWITFVGFSTIWHFFGLWNGWFLCSHSISHSFAALTRSISMWTLEDKFHFSARPCIILYVNNKIYVTTCVFVMTVFLCVNLVFFCHFCKQWNNWLNRCFIFADVPQEKVIKVIPDDLLSPSSEVGPSNITSKHPNTDTSRPIEWEHYHLMF